MNVKLQILNSFRSRFLITLKNLLGDWTNNLTTATLNFFENNISKIEKQF